MRAWGGRWTARLENEGEVMRFPQQQSTQYFPMAGYTVPQESSTEYFPVEEALDVNQYDPPANYGIPNPLGPRLHNWKGGELNEGSLFHGPVYTRPVYSLPRIQRPVFGVETDGENKMSMAQLGLGAVLVGALTYAACEIFLPRDKSR